MYICIYCHALPRKLKFWKPALTVQQNVSQRKTSAKRSRWSGSGAPPGQARWLDPASRLSVCCCLDQGFLMYSHVIYCNCFLCFSFEGDCFTLFSAKLQNDKQLLFFLPLWGADPTPNLPRPLVPVVSFQCLSQRFERQAVSLFWTSYDPSSLLVFSREAFICILRVQSYSPAAASSYLDTRRKQLQPWVQGGALTPNVSVIHAFSCAKSENSTDLPSSSFCKA